MASIKLFIAQSLDGYIALPDGNLDWLTQMENPDQNDHGYFDFLKSIDTVVMGRTTYEEILSFDVDWPYADQKCFVITAQKDYQTSTPNTKALSSIDANTVKEIKTTAEKGVWIVGGGKVIATFLDENSIDEMIITTVPQLLGDGIPLFPKHKKHHQLELVKSESFASGAVNNYYRIKK